ncbi:hypothetical protein B296_00017463 [Ensete ventricosum]|uniref:Uncharacterized protein n=1 Tax=Ensete ventricosum TaxID=4639 RepID=A0A427B2P1_ENSVE|nr:hypothetical protein B296_00017463 [Ensete ventricosum]
METCAWQLPEPWSVHLAPVSSCVVSIKKGVSSSSERVSPAGAAVTTLSTTAILLVISELERKHGHQEVTAVELESLGLVPGDTIRVHEHLHRHASENRRLPYDLAHHGIAVGLERDPLVTLARGLCYHHVLRRDRQQLTLTELAVEDGPPSVPHHLHLAASPQGVRCAVCVDVPIRCADGVLLADKRVTLLHRHF